MRFALDEPPVPEVVRPLWHTRTRVSVGVHFVRLCDRLVSGEVPFFEDRLDRSPIVRWEAPATIFRLLGLVPRTDVRFGIDDEFNRPFEVAAIVGEQQRRAEPDRDGRADVLQGRPDTSRGVRRMLANDFGGEP